MGVAWRTMTGGAAAYRAMRRESLLRMAMTFETEGVEPRLSTCLQVISRALVAHDAILKAPAVAKIVVASQTIDLYVLGMRKVQYQGIRA
jgi:hypothetical protein